MKRRLLAVAACCALTFGAQAQTPLPPPTAAVTAQPAATATDQPATPTPAMSDTPAVTETLNPLTTEPLEVTVSADVLFPAGIAFQLSFREPTAGIRSITMTAEQQGWEGQTIDLDPADVIIDENDLSTVSYLWTVAENPPRLFEPLTITWSAKPTCPRQ